MRKFLRTPLSSFAILSDSEVNSRIVITDFSRMGIGFISKKAPKQNTFVSILYQNETNKLIKMKCFIKHVRMIADNQFAIGVQFVGIESKTVAA